MGWLRRISCPTEVNWVSEFFNWIFTSVRFVFVIERQKCGVRYYSSLLPSTLCSCTRTARSHYGIRRSSRRVVASDCFYRAGSGGISPATLLITRRCKSSVAFLIRQYILHDCWSMSKYRGEDCCKNANQLFRYFPVIHRGVGESISDRPPLIFNHQSSPWFVARIHYSITTASPQYSFTINLKRYNFHVDSAWKLNPRWICKERDAKNDIFIYRTIV